MPKIRESAMLEPVATVVFAPLALAAAIVARPAWGWPQTIAVGATGFLHLAYYVALQREPREPCRAGA